MDHVFISYVRENTREIRKLCYGLTNQGVNELSVEAIMRKSAGLSVDAANGLGALLDGRIKPRPKLGRTWLRSKVEIYLLTALIATNTNSKEYPLQSTYLSSKLAQLQYIIPLPNSLRMMQGEIIFAARAQVQDLVKPVEVWIRTTNIGQHSPVWTLADALGNALSNLENHEPWELTAKIQPVHVTTDVIALFSTDRGIIENTSLQKSK